MTNGRLCFFPQYLLCLILKLSLSHWYPGSGVVLDCIDSRLLPYFLPYVIFSFPSKYLPAKLPYSHLWACVGVCVLVCICLSVCLYGSQKRCVCVCVLCDLILYVPSTIFQLNRDGSSWVEPVLS